MCYENTGLSDFGGVSTDFPIFTHQSYFKIWIYKIFTGYCYPQFYSHHLWPGPSSLLNFECVQVPNEKDWIGLVCCNWTFKNGGSSHTDVFTGTCKPTEVRDPPGDQVGHRPVRLAPSFNFSLVLVQAGPRFSIFWSSGPVRLVLVSGSLTEVSKLISFKWL